MLGLVPSFAVCRGSAWLTVKFHLRGYSACFVFGFGTMYGGGRVGLIFWLFVRMVYLFLTLVVRCWDLCVFRGGGLGWLRCGGGGELKLVVLGLRCRNKMPQVVTILAWVFPRE